YDLPAIAAFVGEQCAAPAHWLGHAQGGLALAATLGGGYLDAARLASLTLCGSQISCRRGVLRLPPLGWVARLLLRRREQVAAGWLGLGEGCEDEPVGVVRESLRWFGLFGRFGEGRQDWAAGLAEVTVPVLALAGAGDRAAPAAACRQLLERFGSPLRESLCLGRVEGFAEDYGQVAMLLGSNARCEVWPLLEHWLRHQRLPERR
ncbi:MAG: alpha/beta hydrolase, partial [Pseudomonas sagittaria]|nr:alpha/beta hydrolase [Pseudomonas sagittaria]